MPEFEPVERRTDLPVRDRVELLLETVRDVIRRMRRRLLLVEIAVAISCAVLIASMVAIAGVPLTGFGGLIGANQDRAEEVRTLVKRVQIQRAASIRRNCEDVNARHDSTIRELDRIVTALPASRRARARQRRAATVALIDALAPHRDCDALVARNVKAP